MPRPGFQNTRRHFVNLDTIAVELKISSRRVQQLAVQGVIVRGGRGKYWLEGSRTRYEEYIRRFQWEKGFTPWAGFKDKDGYFVRVR